MTASFWKGMTAGLLVGVLASNAQSGFFLGAIIGAIGAVGVAWVILHPKKAPEPPEVPA